MKRLVLFWACCCALALMVSATTSQAATCDPVGRQPATLALMKMLVDKPALQADLAESIAMGQRANPDPHTNPVDGIAAYLDFVDALVTYNPQNIDTGVYNGHIRISMDGANYCNWNILDLLAYSYFLVDRQITTDPRGQIQFKDPDFSNWMRQIAVSWGSYLEQSPSAVHVPDFTNDPNFGDWYCPDGKYETFQKFFMRELCPHKDKFPTGSRPVAGFNDPDTVVSIGDSNSMGWWPIGSDGKLVSGYDGVSQGGRIIKGKLYSDIHTFITGEQGETILQEFGEIDPSIFNGGVFTHQFLNVNNYHRLHLPVSGKIVFLRHIQSGTRMKSAWKPSLGSTDPGYYDPIDGPDWQFGQTRYVLGIETPDHGIVIASPMGMAQVSGIRPRDWVEAYHGNGKNAQKGWEFANFAFGGSDFVILFQQEAAFTLTVRESAPVSPDDGVNYQPSLQGEKYGCFGGVTTCRGMEDSALPSPYPRLN